MANIKYAQYYEEWARLYESGLNATEIGRRYGCPAITVLRALRKMGVHLRSISEIQKGRRLSEETKRKLSEKQKIVMNRPEVKAKISAASKAMHADPEIKEKHRKAVAEALNRPEVREKLRLARKGKKPTLGHKLTEEHKQKISEALKGRPHSEEHNRKVSEAKKGKPYNGIPWNKGKRYDESTRQKFREITRALLLSHPEIKEKMRLAAIKRLTKPEIRKKYEKSLQRARQQWKREFTSIELATAKVLDALSIKYEAQKPIGPYIVDFYLPDHNLIIECDGDYWHNLPDVQKRDKRKDAYLRKRGYNILRLKEHEIKEDPEAALLNGLKVVI